MWRAAGRWAISAIAVLLGVLLALGPRAGVATGKRTARHVPRLMRDEPKTPKLASFYTGTFRTPASKNNPCVSTEVRGSLIWHFKQQGPIYRLTVESTITNADALTLKPSAPSWCLQQLGPRAQTLFQGTLTLEPKTNEFGLAFDARDQQIRAAGTKTIRACDKAKTLYVERFAGTFEYTVGFPFKSHVTGASPPVTKRRPTRADPSCSLPPDFRLTAEPSPVSVIPGGPKVESAVTIRGLNGFRSNVFFHVTAPKGINYSISPNPGRTTATLSLSAGVNTAPKDYTVKITGEGGGHKRTIEVQVRVADISLDVAEGQGIVDVMAAGPSKTATLAITGQNGFTGEVNLAVTGTTDTVYAGIDQTAVVPASGSVEVPLLVGALAEAAPGTYPITVGAQASAPGGGDSGARTHLVQVIVKVRTAPRLTVSRTGVGADLGTVQGGISSGPVIDCSATASTCSAELELGVPVTLTATAAPGAVFDGWGGDCSGSGTGACQLTMDSDHSVEAKFSLEGSATFTLTADPPTLTVTAGGQTRWLQAAHSTITVNPVNGFDGEVSFSVAAPNGILANVSPPSSTTVTTLSVSAATTTASGSYEVTVTGTSGDLTKTVIVTVNVIGAGPVSFAGLWSGHFEAQLTTESPSCKARATGTATLNFSQTDTTVTGDVNYGVENLTLLSGDLNQCAGAISSWDGHISFNGTAAGSTLTGSGFTITKQSDSTIDVDFDSVVQGIHAVTHFTAARQ